MRTESIMQNDFAIQSLGSGKYRVSGSIPGYAKANKRSTNQVRRIVIGAAAAEAVRKDLQARRDSALLAAARCSQNTSGRGTLSPRDLASAQDAVSLRDAAKDPRSLLQLVEVGLRTPPEVGPSSEEGRASASTNVTNLPPPALIEAAAKAAHGGLLRIVHRDDGTWELHNPILVDLQTVAMHLGCSVKTVQRKARAHGIGVSKEVGARINLRALVASLEAAAT